jgi:hypothetical protein
MRSERRIVPFFVIFILAVSTLAAVSTFAADENHVVAAACREYDSLSLQNLKKFRHDPTQIENILAGMTVYGEHCSHEKSYEFCAAELKVKLCVDLVQLRKSGE